MLSSEVISWLEAVYAKEKEKLEKVKVDGVRPEYNFAEHEAAMRGLLDAAEYLSGWAPSDIAP